MACVFLFCKMNECTKLSNVNVGLLFHLIHLSAVFNAEMLNSANLFARFNGKANK